MPSPNVPGIPGLKLPPERRPEPVNPPPPESIPPLPSVEVGTVTVARGRWALTMPSVVALALIASVGGFATAWLNKPAPGDPSAIAKAIRDEMAAQKQESATQSAAILKRLDGVETKVDRLQDSQDRLRERVNDRLAQP